MKLNIIIIYLFILKFSFFKIFLFIYFLAASCLRCCAWTFSSCGKWGRLFIAVCRLLIVVASLVAEHGLQVHGLQQLQHTGSVVVARGPQSARASVVVARGLSSCNAQALGHVSFSGCGMWSQQLWLEGSRVQAQQLWHMGLVVPQHVRSSWTRDRTCVPCIGRRILNHCATREVTKYYYYYYY